MMFMSYDVKYVASTTNVANATQNGAHAPDQPTARTRANKEKNMNVQVIENLEALLTAVEAHPESLFDLGTWKREADCGTLFCVAGLACTLPKFQELGLVWNKYDVPTFNGSSMWDDGGDELFGPNSMNELFHASGSGTLDTKLGLDYEEDETYGDITMDCTDKELAIARLKHRIAIYKGEQQ